ncbi:hypothetical protein [Mycoplasma sp. 1018B]|uniref:hypothetical protein n=1 Tax=Mycoplasma sp. 1018B TaxID=2967302 RepID=UPI00211C1553|nr:hypothetical protein [Mycoplasma sp. 1018B]UUM19372.1 hypothetical protein NPA14_00645 [Mycoplasma sp. 1018B]
MDKNNLPEELKNISFWNDIPNSKKINFENKRLIHPSSQAIVVNKKHIFNKKVFVARDLIKTNLLLPIIALIILIAFIIVSWILIDAGYKYDLYDEISATSAVRASNLATVGYYYAKWLTSFFNLLVNNTEEVQALLNNNAAGSKAIIAFALYIVFLLVFFIVYIILVWKLIELIKVNIKYAILASIGAIVIILMISLVISVAKTTNLTFVQVRELVNNLEKKPEDLAQGRFLSYFLLAIALIASGYTAYIFKLGQTNPKLAI